PEVHAPRGPPPGGPDDRELGAAGTGALRAPEPRRGRVSRGRLLRPDLLPQRADLLRRRVAGQGAGAPAGPPRAGGPSVSRPRREPRPHQRAHAPREPQRLRAGGELPVVSLERRRLHVLVVDDSAVVRQTMSSILSRDSRLVTSVAADPLIAMEKMRRDR